jgi:hypothetical protein
MKLDASCQTSAIGLRVRISRLPSPSAIYIGTMPGHAQVPPLDLYNLLVPVGEHPAGSTVSRGTLERHGVPVPAIAARSVGESMYLNRMISREAEAA